MEEIMHVVVKQAHDGDAGCGEGAELFLRHGSEPDNSPGPANPWWVGALTSQTLTPLL